MYNVCGMNLVRGFVARNSICRRFEAESHAQSYAENGTLKHCVDFEPDPSAEVVGTRIDEPAKTNNSRDRDIPQSIFRLGPSLLRG